MNRRFHRLFLVALAPLLGVLAGCGKKSASAPPAPMPAVEVRGHTVEVTPFTVTEEIFGTVRAKLRASIESKVSGRIEQLPVAQGQAVKAGDLLARLDAREVQSRVDQAVAARDQAERDLARLGALLERQAVTPSEFEAVQARTQVARAAAIEAETMMAYSKVLAPFDGVIVRKLAEIGDMAVPGRPLLDIEDPALLRFETDVPESLIGRMQVGAALSVRIPAVDEELKATITEIAPSADARSRTFLVKLDLPAGMDIRSGMFGRIAIPSGEGEALRVPASAVIQRGQMEMVFVAVDGRARMRLVRTGRQIGDEVEVISGISAGERIIVEGAEQLSDGRAISEKGKPGVKGQNAANAHE